MYIAERFNANYPRYAGHFAQVIDFHTEYAQSLIDHFSQPMKLPQIAISVDMLDTGIDVPEVVNLVFFKEIRSKTKFWQMVGRGTRLCPDLFGPGENKQEFYIFDFCGNLEFFSQEMAGTEGSSGASLGQRLFATRVKLLTAMMPMQDEVQPNADQQVKELQVKEVRESYVVAETSVIEPNTDREVYKSIIELLKFEVGAMNVDNFIVRAKRRLVEKYKEPASWFPLDGEKLAELEREIAGLPSEKEPEPVEAKQFDLLMLRLQLATVKGTPGFKQMKQQVMNLAAILEESRTIPVIGVQIALIQELQSESWWENVTVQMLEIVRLRLRPLMRLIEHKKGSPVYSNFTEEMGEPSEVVLPAFTIVQNFERFRDKARAFLKNHLDSQAVQKLRQNLPLSSGDLNELEALLQEPAANDPDLLVRARQNNLGLFVRSLVGMERAVAQKALSEAISDLNLSSNQITFVEMIIDHISQNGYIEDHVLYESPYTDVCSEGPEGLFSPEALERIFGVLEQVRHTAQA
jgi:type I restriction enzyme R subunit